MPSLTSCVNHPRRPAVGTCPSCGRSFCEQCMTYRGSKYLCKGCAGPAPGTATLIMAEGRGGAAEPLEGTIPSASGKSRYSRKSSKYDFMLRLRHLMKRLALLFILLLAGIAAYLPYIAKYAMDDALSGAGYLPATMAPRLVNFAGRVHLLYGRADDAINIYEAGIENLPPEEQAEAYFYLGKAHMKELEFPAARKAMETFIRRWPRHDLAIRAGEIIKNIDQIEAARGLRHVETPNVRDGTYGGPGQE